MLSTVLLLSIIVNAIFAFSIQVALRAGIFSLAGVGCWGIGAYTVAIMTTKYDVAPGVAMLVAMVFGATVSWLLALTLVRLRGLYLAMTTVAFDFMVAIVALNGGDFTAGATGIYGVPYALSLWHVVAIFLVVVAGLTLLESRALGRSFEVAREDEQLAQVLAVDTARYRRFAFLISGLLGALAGAMNVLLIGLISPAEISFRLIVLGLTMVIVGGFRSWIGAFVGAALVTWLPLGLQSLAEWWDVVYGLLIIVVAVVAPGGIYGFAEHVRRGLSERRHRSRKSAADLVGAT